MLFPGRLRIHTCRVILLTSLVWFLVDVVVLSFYSECLGGSCNKKDVDQAVADALVDDNEDDYGNPEIGHAVVDHNNNNHNGGDDNNKIADTGSNSYR